MNTASEISAPTPLPDNASEAPIAADAGKPIAHGLALVIADRGWVWLGTATTVGDWTHIAAARCVIRFGTDAGLNQLIKGPRPNTSLGDPADMKVLTRAVIAITPVEADKWANA